MEKAYIVRRSEVSVSNNKSLHGEKGVELFTNNAGMTIRVIQTAFASKTNQIKTIPCPPWCPNCYWCTPTGGGGSGGCAEPCERDCEDGKENIYRFRTKRDYDGGFRGKGEWFFVAIFAEDISYTIQNGAVVLTGNPLAHIKTGIVPGVAGNYSWYSPNFSLIRWNTDTDGDRIKVAVYESDGGSTKTVSFKLKFSFEQVSFEFPINFQVSNGDDYIGEYIVDYCDDFDFPYHPAYQVVVEHNER